MCANISAYICADELADVCADICAGERTDRGSDTSADFCTNVLAGIGGYRRNSGGADVGDGGPVGIYRSSLPTCVPTILPTSVPTPELTSIPTRFRYQCRPRCRRRADIDAYRRTYGVADARCGERAEVCAVALDDERADCGRS